jgi:hypothetical protein
MKKHIFLLTLVLLPLYGASSSRLQKNTPQLNAGTNRTLPRNRPRRRAEGFTNPRLNRVHPYVNR